MWRKVNKNPLHCQAIHKRDTVIGSEDLSEQHQGQRPALKVAS